MPTKNKDLETFAKFVAILRSRIEQGNVDGWTCRVDWEYEKAILDLPNGYRFIVTMGESEALSFILFSNTQAVVLECLSASKIITADKQHYALPPKTKQQLIEIHQFVWKNAPWSQAQGLKEALQAVQEKEGN